MASIERTIDAVFAINSPDIVEGLFTTTNNPTQQLAFAYAKKTSDGHYIVAEAVGGKNKTSCIINGFALSRRKDAEKTASFFYFLRKVC